MKKLLLLTLICLMVGSCTYSNINFERMSAADLAAYNRTQPISQMIVCGEDDRSFTRIRRRSCATVEKMYGSVEQAGQIGVLNSIPGYAGFE